MGESVEMGQFGIGIRAPKGQPKPAQGNALRSDPTQRHPRPERGGPGPVAWSPSTVSMQQKVRAEGQGRRERQEI